MPRYDGTDELSGAEYLASIYGTEKGFHLIFVLLSNYSVSFLDKVNCSFFFKVCVIFLPNC